MPAALYMMWMAKEEQVGGAEYWYKVLAMLQGAQVYVDMASSVGTLCQELIQLLTHVVFSLIVPSGTSHFKLTPL